MLMGRAAMGLGWRGESRNPPSRQSAIKPFPLSKERDMSDDTHLKQSVLDELKWEPSVNAAHIGVTTRDGIVTLTGSVETYAEKHAAETATFRVKDVKAVAEEIEVKLPFGIHHGDADIAAAAVERLAWNVSVPKDAVKVAVTKGWVTLTGTVHWHYQHDAAADAVRTLWGVTGLSNQIGITPQANAGNIKANIMGALDRSWFAPENINVAAQDGKVTLSGTVEYWSERDLAGTTAWAAPGVTSVKNDIRVN
jgi:osmotically-inducible protein OsmY